MAQKIIEAVKQIFLQLGRDATTLTVQAQRRQALEDILAEAKIKRDAEALKNARAGSDAEPSQAPEK